MVYYVAYRLPLDPEDRIQVEGQLKTLGCRQIRASFWAISKGSLSTAGKILQKYSPVLLRRTREIRKPSLTKEREQRELGSLIVIAYKIDGGMKRVKVRSWLRRSPCLRLCPNVCAFPQRHFLDKTGRLVNAGSFWEYVREFDEDAVIIPRLIIVNGKAVDRLLNETENRVKKEVAHIIDGYKSLVQKVKQNRIDRLHAGKIARALRRRFIIVKKISAFYEEWLKLDLSAMIMKPYPAIRKARFLLEERYGTAGW
jgi:hypothetical protein